jgi:transposase
LAYFHSRQFIPLARTAEMVGGLYQQPVSEARILAAVAEMAKQVAPVNEALKTYLVETAEAVHFDETGLRVCPDYTGCIQPVPRRERFTVCKPTAAVMAWMARAF